MKKFQGKDAILVVGDYNRRDFLQFFTTLKDQFDIYFLEYSYRDELRNNYYENYGKAIFWKDFFSAQHLLKKTKPGAVIFFFIESLNHIALLNACKVAGIKTYHLEHGFRDLDFQLYLKNQGLEFSSNSIRKEIPFFVRLRTRLFFEMTRLFLPAENRNFLSLYKGVRLKNSILDTFLQIRNGLRTADHYISFSPGVYKFHQQLDGLEENQLVSFVGLPNLDYIKDDTTKRPDFNNLKIVFIDSGFHVEESFGWTKDSRTIFLNKIKNAVLAAGQVLWIKKHPLDHTDFWNHGDWNIIGEEEWFSGWMNYNIILGEYSTLMIPLSSLSHTICFCFETHPIEGYKISNFLTAGGVCDEIKEPEELSVLLKRIDMLCEIYNRQRLSKSHFLEKWLTVLDGSSTDRFTKIIKMTKNTR